MGDEEFDPCECYWNHEVAMRRLLSLLRQGQSFCTDNECIDDLPGAPQRGRGDFSGMFFMMMAWMVVALVLYMMRPSSLRNNQLDTKPHNNQDQQGPPAPPSLM